MLLLVLRGDLLYTYISAHYKHVWCRADRNVGTGIGQFNKNRLTWFGRVECKDYADWPERLTMWRKMETDREEFSEEDFVVWYDIYPHILNGYRPVTQGCTCYEHMENKNMFCGTRYMSHCHTLHYNGNDVIASCQPLPQSIAMTCEPRKK